MSESGKKNGLRGSLKEKETNVRKKEKKKRTKCRDSLHTTVLANLLRHKLTSDFKIKA